MISDKPQSSAHYIVRFGKYKGKTIVDVFNEDPDYIFWLVKGTCSAGGLIGQAHKDFFEAVYYSRQFIQREKARMEKASQEEDQKRQYFSLYNK